MSVKNGVISGPINLGEVAQVFSVTTKDVGYLCSNAHGQTNMFSLKKPIHIANALGTPSGDWWKGSDHRCGIEINGVTDYAEIPSVYDNTNELHGWSYNPPFGGALSPYRITDFDGYNHNAKPPVLDFLISEKVIKGAEGQATITTNYDNTAVRLEDIEIKYGNASNLGEFAFGIVITDTKGAVKDRVAMKGDTCEFHTRFLTEGSTYYAYPFLSGNPIGQGDLDEVNLFYPLPFVNRKSFRVVSRQEFLGITIRFEASYTSEYLVHIKLTVTSEQNYTFSNNWITLKYGGADHNSPQTVYDRVIQVPDFTVAAGGTYTYEDAIGVEGGYTYIAYYQLDTNAFSGASDIMQPM